MPSFPTEPGFKLNPAGWLASLFYDSKLTPLVMLAITVFGALALLLTPRTYNPEIVMPVVNISVSRPGSDSKEMFNQIVRPLEGLMAAIPGTDHTYGYATDDKAIVTVRFKVGENEENSLVKVYDQINSNLNLMPPGTRMPLIQSASLYDVPIVTLTLSSKTLDALKLREIATHLLTQLRAIPKVGKVWVAGVAPPAMLVDINPDKLAAYHLSLNHVIQILDATNVAADAGHIVANNHEIPIRINALINNSQELENVMLGTFSGHPVFLRDVATTNLAPENEIPQSYFAFGLAAHKKYLTGINENAVTISIARQKGSNGVEVANHVMEKLTEIKKSSLPDGVNITVTRNYGNDANDAVNTLIAHLGISILAVVFILLMFLSWRESAVVAFSIPLILCIVLGISWISGQTINRITLFALILSLGLLVDDSIVVIENINRHHHIQAQPNFGMMIINAANEIGRPTIIATFTVILALIPMAFVTGMMGPFMQPIPFNAPIAMLASLIIAYTAVPYLAYRWTNKKKEEMKQQSGALHAWLLKRYSHFMRSLLDSSRYRKLFMLGVGLMLGLAMLQPIWPFIRPAGANHPLGPFAVGLKMLPNDNVNTLLIEIDTPAGTPAEDTARVADAVDILLSKTPSVTDYQTFIGEAAPQDFAAMVRGDATRKASNFAQIRVNLLDKSVRKSDSHTIAQVMDKNLEPIRDHYPETLIKILETPPGPPVRSQMMTALYGPNYTKLLNLAKTLRTKIYPEIYGMSNIDDSVSHRVNEDEIKINKYAASLAGFTPRLLSNEIRTDFAGRTVGSLHQQNKLEPENIILRLPPINRNNDETLKNLYLVNPSGQSIALADIATVRLVAKNQPIYSFDQHPVVYVTGDMMHSSPVNAVVTIAKKAKKIKMSSGANLGIGNLGFLASKPDDLQHYQLFFQGEMRLTLDVFRDLGSAFIVALMLIYLLLAGYYRSFALPFIIMGAIPLTLIGVFPGHWLLSQPFTATSMIGVIALAGIVVRNSLLLIDFILEREAMGTDLIEAIMEATVIRLRPIILTALAIILGSAPMLTDPVFGGLAISLIFGAVASTTLTLFVIPLTYFTWRKKFPLVVQPQATNPAV
ncbi:MAG: efflux RND transporter permease subunit [Pseudomonadota bacterium]|nr:efflux RND transporter permease subunit [Pseudomonadota bacterium]